MHAAPPEFDELDALIRLLDDETPEVRERVAERFGQYGGDLSEWLSSRSYDLSAREKAVLEQMLLPSRRHALKRDWVMPTGGASALQEDWESFEALLRTLSDFLHDGITLRQPLSDALDLLAEEAAESGVITERDLCTFLFDGSRFQGNRSDYYDPRNSDLAWSIAEGISNPIGLSLIFLLTARRLEMDAEGVNFPGHFLVRIYEEGHPLIIDCFDNGRMHLQAALLESGSELTRQQRSALRESAGPGMILARLLNNLVAAFDHAGRKEDAELISALQKTL